MTFHVWSGGGAAVRWIRPNAGLIRTYARAALVDEILEATSPFPPLDYIVVAGELPFGLILANIGDIAILRGFAQSGPPPLWQTPPGLVDTIAELAAPTATLLATPVAPAADIIYYVVRGGLPRGVLLDRDTGALGGAAAILIGAFPPDSPTDPPIWNNPAAAASLGTVAERASVSITGWADVTFTGANPFYRIVAGALPRGLVMDRATGDISGAPADVNGAPPPPPADPPDTALVPPPFPAQVGNPFGPANYGTALFAPIAPKTMARFEVVSGRLPLGLTLDRTTGDVAGTPTRSETLTVTIRGFDDAGAFTDLDIPFDILP